MTHLSTSQLHVVYSHWQTIEFTSCSVFTYFSDVAVDTLFKYVQHEVGTMTFIVELYVTCLTFKLHLHIIVQPRYSVTRCIDSAPSYESIICCRWLCLSVSPSVTVLLQIASSFFVSRWNRAIFWPSVLHVALYKTFSSIFDLGPLNPKIYSPKFGTKSPISRLVWQIDRKCLGLVGGFRGSMLWGRPLLPWQRHLLGAESIAWFRIFCKLENLRNGFRQRR